MELELVAENLGSDISFLGDYEVCYQEGDTGELRLYVDQPLSYDDVSQLEYEICSQGVVLIGPIKQDARVVVISFQKAIAPLAIIAIIVGGIVAIAAGLLGWQIFKYSKLGVPVIVWVVGLGALAYLLFSSEPAKQAGGLAIQAGKVYVTKKAMK